MLEKQLFVKFLTFLIIIVLHKGRKEGDDHPGGDQHDASALHHLPKGLRVPARGQAAGQVQAFSNPTPYSYRVSSLDRVSSARGGLQHS